MITLKLDSVLYGFANSRIMLYTATEWLYSPLVNILLKRTFSVTPLRNLPVNKRLRNFGWIPFVANSSSMYTKNLFAPPTSDLLEKLALIFLYNFHRNHILLTLKMKRLSPKINVKNIKTPWWNKEKALFRLPKTQFPFIWNLDILHQQIVQSVVWHQGNLHNNLFCKLTISAYSIEPKDIVIASGIKLSVRCSFISTPL